MRLAKTFLLAFPLCIVLINSASAGLVFNLNLVGSSDVDITAPPLTRTINVYAFENVPTNAPATILFDAISLTPLAGDPDITFTHNLIIPGPSSPAFPYASGTTGLGNLLGQITATVSNTASYLDARSVTFVGTVGTYTHGTGVFTSNAIGITAVPEPGTFGLLAMGGMGLAFMRRRRS